MQRICTVYLIPMSERKKNLLFESNVGSSFLPSNTTDWLFYFTCIYTFFLSLSLSDSFFHFLALFVSVAEAFFLFWGPNGLKFYIHISTENRALAFYIHIHIFLFLAAELGMREKKLQEKWEPYSYIYRKACTVTRLHAHFLSFLSLSL